ncbi:hypothetical protein Pmani_024302 [Petrolisthes manimaculis]|uniref:G-protein coupled receptors family 2 profile 2 domain-containing protein n=1 Tax=Petrolisthes manimaculis TaxID=1843537 RepID=A0AAE1U070_9EUCA|nr:hypothetical protein Pmani_024302 [Petrolisthes manimaculis]
MEASLRYISSVVVLLCVRPGQLVPTTTVPVLTSNTTHVNSDVVEYVSITSNPEQFSTTDLSMLTTPISVIDVTPPTELLYQNIPDRISVNVDIPGNQKDKALIKSDDSIKINNPNSEDTSVNREVNEKEITSIRADYETTPLTTNVTLLLLPNDTPDTTHISILLDAQDVITEEVEHETQPFDNNRTDATTTWEATRTTQQHTPTNDNTSEAKSNTTNDKMNNNTSEEIGNTTGTLTNTDIASEEIDNITGALNNTNITRKPLLIEGRVPSYPGQLVKCYCGAKEVLTKDGCQFYQGDTYIMEENSRYEIDQKPVGSLEVVIYEPECKTVHGHRQMNFNGDEFYLRQRGDVVLMESVGLLQGLRINNYCVKHTLDDDGQVTWTMKACIPPPSVPRCCPPGEAMKQGQCQPTLSPNLLTPPMSADMNVGDITWPFIENHISPLTCVKDPIQSLPLEPMVTYLLNVPTGMVFTWDPSVFYITRKFFYPNEFCVDGRETSSGVVEYSANFCFSDPLKAHNEACQGHTCVRKCCEHGQTMSSTLYKCIDHENSTFSPPFIVEPSSFKTVIGKPLCGPQTLEENITIDAWGHLYVNDQKFEATNYCSDKFYDGEGNFKQGVLVCLASLSEWEKARDIAFPVCQAISLVFLALTVVCYCLVPVLLQQGGWCQLFHVLSLMLAYSSGFSQQLFSKNWIKPTCIAMAIVMQFGYLCTFFWLSVLCFEVWRKIKSLNKLRPTTKLPLRIYLLYAFGGPFLICTVTVCMQFWAPDDVVGVVKPHLGDSRCWFPDTMEILVYFYGPIAFLFTCNIAFITHTFWIYRQIERNAKVLKNLGGEKTSGEGSTEASTPLRTVEHKYRRRDYVADFKQQFSLLVLTSICWVTEVLSWKIPPFVMWAPTDILNTLQGFFVFIIFVANRSKRKHLKKKFPTVFVGVKIVTSVLVKIKGAFMFTDSKGKAVSPINLLTSSFGRKISTTSLISNISTLSTSLTVNSSSSSFYLSSFERSDPKRSSSISDSDDGIITLSHSSLTLSGSNSSASPC